MTTECWGAAGGVGVRVCVCGGSHGGNYGTLGPQRGGSEVTGS